MAEAEGATRTIPLVHAVGLVVANMIGTGAFTTTGLLAAELGNPLWLLGAWLVGGIVALCGADVYAELGATMPRAGGEYVYLSRAFHPCIGFLSGWISLIVGFSAPIAASAIAFASYLTAVVPFVAPMTAAVALVIVVTALHMASVRWGTRVQTFFAGAKVALVLLFVIAGIIVGRGSFEHFTIGGGPPEPSRLAVALIYVSFAYSGWNAAAYIAGEMKSPASDLPRALVGGTVIVVSLYLALNVVFLYALTPQAMAGEVEIADLAARSLFGPTAGSVLSLLIALALVSSVSAMIMAGPRVYVAMAEDGLFFRPLARRAGSGAPWASVALQGSIAAVLVVTATFEQLLVYIGFTLSVFAALTVLAAFVLRRREPDTARPYRARGWPLSPILFLSLSLWMSTYAIITRPTESLAGLITVALGMVLYWARTRTRSFAGSSAATRHQE
ncbi:MAG TPA: amino acid permease [Labilithrix sp.]|nr:amino acid permease [Labilithrix sp.]